MQRSLALGESSNARMICPVCGKESPCSHTRRNSVLLAETVENSALQSEYVDTAQDPAEGPDWRDVVASRVQQHRARRRGSPRNDDALEFDFPPAEALAVTEEPVVRYQMKRGVETDQVATGARAFTVSPNEPKIIRFPRTLAAAGKSTYLQPEQAYVPLPEPELEPMLPAHQEITPEPRIIEVSEGVAEMETGTLPPIRAEQLNLLPSFDDIRLEPAHSTSVGPVEIIPRPASLQQRGIAAIIDVSGVAVAAVLFDFIFVRLAEDDPHSHMALLCGVGVTAILWIIFQYLFLVHGEGTPGMQLADLELATFDGKRVGANARRCRALASMLSAFSLGLGYAWAFIDEDRLGWHDRITGTLVRATGIQPTRETEIWK